jgi:hypothetical protein
MPTIRVSMKCCPIAGQLIIPNRFLRIAWKNHAGRRPDSASDANVDAHCDSQRTVPSILIHRASPLPGVLQFKKQYASAGRLLKQRHYGILIHDIGIEMLALQIRSYRGNKLGIVRPR